MRIPFVAGNWKMHTKAAEAEELARSLVRLLEGVENVNVALCPPFPYLPLVAKVLRGTRIRLGGQNMCSELEGAYTGEVSARMLKDVGCDFVILGHSERRRLFGETDESVRRKIRQALDVGLLPIVCVGETLDQREVGKTVEVVGSQVKGCLQGFGAEEMRRVTVAYEPVWAIGTGKTATPEQAQEVHGFIRTWLSRTFGDDVSENLRIQYGGSVKPENAVVLMSQPDIDGALVGGASLKAESFAAIVEAAVS